MDQRSMQDYRNWNSHLVNKQYYELHPDGKQYRTMFVNLNSLNGKPRIHSPTNWVTGTPPDNIPAISPLMLARIRSGNMNVPF